MSGEDWLSAEAFSAACSALPLVSIDLFITRPGIGSPEVLLGCRKNPPALGWWFTPGGRIRKNESLARAISRIAHEEVGLESTDFSGVELLGAWDHFYPDSAFDPQVSTHYVNLAYLVALPNEAVVGLLPPGAAGSQHSAWCWLAVDSPAADPSVHENVRMVLKVLIERT